jgi:hypothetical protein
VEEWAAWATVEALVGDEVLGEIDGGDFDDTLPFLFLAIVKMQR